MNPHRPYLLSEHYETVMDWNVGDPATPLAEQGWEHVMHVGVLVDRLDDFTTAALSSGLFGREDLWSDGDCWEVWAEPMSFGVAHVLVNAPHILTEDTPYWQCAVKWHIAGLIVPMNHQSNPESNGVIATGSSLADFADEDRHYPEWRA